MTRKRRYLDESGGPQDPPKKKTSEEVINSYIGTREDPTVFYKKENLIKNNIQESTVAENIGDYFNSYANSEGVKRIQENQYNWYSNYHPIRNRWYGRILYGNPNSGANFVINRLKNLNTKGVFDISASSYNNGREHDLSHDVIFIGDPSDHPYEHPRSMSTTHELMHRIPNEKLRGAQSDALDKNRNTIINGHDEFNDEKYGDLQGLRYLLYEEGIYDSRGKKDATPENIEQLREKYPNLRPLEQMDNNKAAWMINHVVQNNNNDLYRRSLKHGGIYIKPSHRGRFTALKERTGHSATWFKENGTPAQKKMATFALNAAKWNH